MDNTETVSLWKKTAAETTVADQMKIIGIVTAASVVLPAIAVGIAAGVGALVEKRQARKAEKSVVEIVK